MKKKKVELASKPSLNNTRFVAIILISASFMVLSFAACRKSSSPVNKVNFTYTGQGRSSYNHQSMDYQTGFYTREDWDSTYNDAVNVMIDRDLNTIQFTLQRHPYQAQPSEYTYPLDETKNVYTTFISTKSIQSFEIFGDSLNCSYGSFVGYGSSDYTKVRRTFKGAKVK